MRNKGVPGCDIMPGSRWNIRTCTVAMFLAVTVLFLTGYLDIHIASVDKGFHYVWQKYLHMHEQDGLQIGGNRGDWSTGQTDAKDRAMGLADTGDQATGQTDIDDFVTKPISLSCPWNNSSLPLDEKTKKKYEIHDLFRIKTPDFLSNYRNPCWRQDSSSKLVCLPYFYLAGFPKCGTTFTFSTMTGHPWVAKGKAKEPHWISRLRFGVGSHFQSYLDYFSPAAREIESNTFTDSFTGKMFHPVITGDGSASTAWHNPNWPYLPGNYDCTEPRVLTPHYVYYLNPSTKVIIVIRNPTNRLISAYNYFIRSNVTAENFHKSVVDYLKSFEDCRSMYSLRTCAYNNASRLLVGVYHVFIRDWMKVVPPDQILLARLEDMHDDPYTAFTSMFDFLGLSHVSRLELHEMIKRSMMNDRQNKFKAKDETTRLLDDFYRPHNIQLAGLLKQHNPNLYSHIPDDLYSH